MQSSLRIQLWSYNYDPEPTGIGPVSRVWAGAMRDRGHDVHVIAAHPHYPAPRWGTKLMPYRETRDRIPVLRLPLWIGRASAGERYRQELSFMLALSTALPGLGRADVIVSVSPCFPAFLPAIVNARLRRTPWVVWLQDILPDGAAVTGLIDDGVVLRVARRLERMAYQAAEKIVVPSRSFEKNLIDKGVPESKIEVIYNPATRISESQLDHDGNYDALRILSMGNIGYSQGLAPLVRALEDDCAPMNAKLIIAGTGVAAEEVRAEIRSERVEMLGLLDDARLESELACANVALVSQRYVGTEFNIPSKIMNFMAYGLPVIAAVNPDSEAARIVRESQGGWVIDSADPEGFPAMVRAIAESAQTKARHSAAAYKFAQAHFTSTRMAERFERTLFEAVEGF